MTLNRNLIKINKLFCFLFIIKLHKAICKDNNCLSWPLGPSPDAANAAKMPVKVVPILLPKVSGKILSKSTNPKPTSGINELVKTELDWTINKAIKPVKYLPTAPPGKSLLIPFLKINTFK